MIKVLVNGATGAETPLDSQQGAESEILELQKNAALAIASQLRADLSNQERQSIAKSMAVDPRAYIEFRRGIDALDVIGFANADEVIAHFARARELDPDFLQPYIQQAWALWWPTIYGTDTTTANEAFTEALAVLEEAQEVFPDEPIIPPTKAFFRIFSDYKFKEAKVVLENPDRRESYMA